MDKLKREFDSLTPSKESFGIVPRKDAFEVKCDVEGYEPHELTVNLTDDTLTLSGKHEERNVDGSRFVARTFQRKYTLPKDAKAEYIRARLVGNTMRVEAPLATGSTWRPLSPYWGHKAIPIEYGFGRRTTPALTY